MISKIDKTLYDKSVADSYDAARKGEEHWGWEAEFIKGWFKSNHVSSVLDLPVGTGRFLDYYGHVGIKVGVDISPDMLRQAELRAASLSLKRPIILEIGDVSKLRFTDKEFDVAIVIRLFHLLDGNLLAAAIRELCRVTAAKIVVQSYIPMPRWKVRLKRLRMLFRVSSNLEQPAGNVAAWAHIPAHYHSKDMLDRLFNAHGFCIAERQTLGEYQSTLVTITVFARKA